MNKIDEILREHLDLRVDSGQAYIYDTDEAVAAIKALIAERERLARISILERVCCCDNDPINKDDLIDVCSGQHIALIAKLTGIAELPTEEAA